MKRVAIITDSNSGFEFKDERDGFYVLPMPFIIDEKEYIEGVSLDKELFYQFMGEGKKISTVQSPLAEILKLYKEVLEKYDEILHIPMSSSLSDTYQTCVAVANQVGEGRVFVADSKKISVPLKRNLMDVFHLVEEGLSANEIKDILEKDNESMKAYVALDTLKYLNLGGRGSSALTTIGSILRIKPVVFLGPGKLESAKNVRTMNQAKEFMLERAKEILKENPEDFYVDIAHANTMEEALIFKEQIISELNWKDEILIENLTLSIATHIGPGALALAITDKLKK